MASQIVDNMRPKFKISIQTEKVEPWTHVHSNKTCNTVEEIGPLIQEAFEQYIELPSRDKEDIFVYPWNSFTYKISYSKILDDVMTHKVALEARKKMSYMFMVPEEQISARNESRVSVFIGPYEESTPIPASVRYDEDDDRHGGGYPSDDEDDYRCHCGYHSCDGDCGLLRCGCIDVCRCHCYDYDSD